MATNQRIQTTELDFDAIKQNLKTFLQGQSEFSDYDFEGSGLSILLDVLAYNTHYNALYTNLAINEAFLDSASKRSSVVSKANELGYLPSSASAAVATVAVTMINSAINAPATVTIPKNATFTCSIDDTTYTFYTSEAYTAVRNGNQYIFPSVKIREGTLLEYRYIIGQQARLIIPNQSVDLSTLEVTVQENQQSSTSDVYQRADQILSLDSTSKVYFVKEIADQLYEVEFGNGVVGAQLQNGNIVTVRYIVCNQQLANGGKVFSYTGPVPTGSWSVSTATLTASTAGSAPETIDQIKWNAPRAYATQNRCVTAEDFKSVIARYYPEAKSVSVWGGETSTPPQYGKVFISIIPKTTDFVSDSDKQYILNTILNPRKALTITPEIVDPAYINIQLNITAYYNPQKTTRGASDIGTLIRSTISNYNTTSLNSFEGVFKYSRLSGLIDDTEDSIVSNIMTVLLHRAVAPVYNTSTRYVINLGNPIYRDVYTDEAVISSGFVTPDSAFVCYIDNDPDTTSDIGNLRLFYRNSIGQKVVLRTVGTINYATGTITINDLNVTRLNSPTWNFVITPQSNDVASTYNQFVQISQSLTTVNVVVDTPPASYAFTSSRT